MLRIKVVIVMIPLLTCGRIIEQMGRLCQDVPHLKDLIFVISNAKYFLLLVMIIPHITSSVVMGTICMRVMVKLPPLLIRMCHPRCLTRLRRL